MPFLSPDEIRIQYDKAMAEFVEAQRATLAPTPADLEGMSAAHDIALRLKAATANRTIWAERLAAVMSLPECPVQQGITVTNK